METGLVRKFSVFLDAPLLTATIENIDHFERNRTHICQRVSGNERSEGVLEKLRNEAPRLCLQQAGAGRGFTEGNYRFNSASLPHQLQK
jgi:hypothetical protein